MSKRREKGGARFHGSLPHRTAIFFKMGHSRPLFQYVRLFNTVGGENNFANDWIQTALPTEPQPLPSGLPSCSHNRLCQNNNKCKNNDYVQP